MEEKEAKRLYELLLDNGIQTWVVGGWGIDALYGEQTRSHKDLDVIMRADDIFKACQIMHEEGYISKALWSENRPVKDSFGNLIDTAFILQDCNKCGLDIHAIIFDKAGNGLPAWNETEDFFFSNEDLGGSGTIDGASVQCITVQSQLVCHSGYEIPGHQMNDLKILKRLKKHRRRVSTSG